MHKLREIHPNDLLNILNLNSGHVSRPYVEFAIQRHKYCYHLSIDVQQFSELLANASIKKPIPPLPLPEIRTLGEILDQIKLIPRFLDDNNQYVGLFSKRVKDYLEGFRLGEALKDCVIQDIMHGMNPEKQYYIIDGMHSLVAYGLWSNLNANYFPIHVYLCTNYEIT